MSDNPDDIRLRAAARLASDIVETAGFERPPVCPFTIAASEHSCLTLIGDDFRDSFDGQIEYHAEHARFLLFYNTKYDERVTEGERHPRTRFSVSHELGHFYIDNHRAYLMASGMSHRSRSEFSSDIVVEREADHFAASLLMPKYLFEPRANKGELSSEYLEELSAMFQTSLVSTAIRAVQLSHFPCALVGLRQGKKAWQFISDPMKEGKCYPGPKGSIESSNARDHWDRFAAGETKKSSADGRADHWFRLYGRAEEKELWVTEYYMPVQTMETLVVLLTMSEQELFDL